MKNLPLQTLASRRCCSPSIVIRSHEYSPRSINSFMYNIFPLLTCFLSCFFFFSAWQQILCWGCRNHQWGSQKNCVRHQKTGLCWGVVPRRERLSADLLSRRVKSWNRHRRGPAECAVYGTPPVSLTLFKNDQSRVCRKLIVKLCEVGAVMKCPNWFDMQP